MIRCSSISKIMTNPRSKSEEWSETAKGAMLDSARETMFGVRKSLDDVRCIQKGVMCEDAGIQLYNDVFLYDLKKVSAEERRSNGIITGEPDLLAIGSRKGVDIKVAWSLLTFPLNAEQAGKKAYEWQARGYMCLFDVPEWEIAYCAIDTPEDLLKPWDNPRDHYIDPSIPMHHRITVARFQRDMKLEEAMLERCEKANQWTELAITQFASDHDEYIDASEEQAA
jgi:hypothetical protein